MGQEKPNVQDPRMDDVLSEVAALREQQSQCWEAVHGKFKGEIEALQTENRSRVDEIQDHVGRSLGDLRKEHKEHLQHVEALREQHESDINDVKHNYLKSTGRVYVV